MSRTRKAIQILKDNPGMTQRKAAELAGIDQSGLNEALQRNKRLDHMRCVHCGSVIPYLKEVFKK